MSRALTLTAAILATATLALTGCGGSSGSNGGVPPGWTPEGLTRDEVIEVLGEPETVTHEDALVDADGNEMVAAEDTLIYPDGSEVTVDAETGEVTFWATTSGWDVDG